MQQESSHGFTLIELLVVIVVIVILASIAYPTYTSMQERAKVTADMNNLRQIGLATQMYLNDNDGQIFSSSSGTWMSQLEPKYIPVWKIFQSPFDKRTSSEKGDATTPISYGLNGLNGSIIGTLIDKVTNSTVFILFAPAQTSATTVTFQGTAATAAPGVTVLGQGSSKALSAPGGSATGGTHNSRSRVNACMADLHVENMLWTSSGPSFTNNTNSSSDPSAAQRWSP